MDVTLWVMAMAGLLPFILLQRGKRPVHKVRVWLALLGASAAAWAVTPAIGYVPVLAYIAIDTAAGLIVLARPAGVAQKAIGFLFATMVLFHIGVFWAGPQHAGSTYFAFQTAAGWAQLLVLLGWSGHDVGKSLWDRVYRALPLRAAAPDSGAGR
jgi:hypothetical protein